jgi:hypothetical protein
LLFRRRPRLISSSDRIFQAGDLCAQLLLFFCVAVAGRLERP